MNMSFSGVSDMHCVGIGRLLVSCVVTLGRAAVSGVRLVARLDLLVSFWRQK